MSVELANEVRAYLRHTDASVSRFGRAAAGHGDFVRVLTLGRQVRPALAARVRQFMARHPDGHPDIARTRAASRTSVDDRTVLDIAAIVPGGLGPAPFPPLGGVDEDHGNLAARIRARATREQRDVAGLLSELVAVGYAARYGEAA